MIKKGSYFIWAVLFTGLPEAAKVELKPRTVEAFDNYLRAAEAAHDQELGGTQFLWVDGSADRKRAVLQGKVLAEPSIGKGELDIPDGLIHDWTGAVFIPGISLPQLLEFMQDYGSHKRFYKPEVIDSRVVSRQGDEFQVALRLVKKQVLTVVLNTQYHVAYNRVDQTRASSKSFSTRIAEVESPGERTEQELPPGRDHGFLWRLDSFWRFEERDGGVYMECRAISLSRDVPKTLAWLVTPMIRSLSRDSLTNTLEATRRGIGGEGEIAARLCYRLRMPVASTAIAKYVRYRKDDRTAYGVLEDSVVREISGDLLGSHEQTGAVHPLSAVSLLYPCEPSKILAVGRNYKSHLLGDRQQPDRPEMFYKPASALQHPGGPIVIPPEATNVHFEGELVIVISKRLSGAAVDEAHAAIFGVTCGNDVSDREWQSGAGKDLQWWRAKGSDTFAPLGPAVVTGLDYGNLMLETRLNGEVVQKQSTADLVFDCPTVVSWVSRWVTLMPGDVIYTGTPGKTRAMKRGDVVEVAIEGIGVLQNTVV